MVEPGRSRGRRRSALALPGVEPDVVVVAAGAEERGRVAVARVTRSRARRGRRRARGRDRRPSGGRGRCRRPDGSAHRLGMPGLLATASVLGGHRKTATPPPWEGMERPLEKEPPAIPAHSGSARVVGRRRVCADSVPILRGCGAQVVPIVWQFCVAWRRAEICTDCVPIFTRGVRVAWTVAAESGLARRFEGAAAQPPAGSSSRATAPIWRNCAPASPQWRMNSLEHRDPVAAADHLRMHARREDAAIDIRVHPVELGLASSPALCWAGCRAVGGEVELEVRPVVELERERQLPEPRLPAAPERLHAAHPVADPRPERPVVVRHHARIVAEAVLLQQLAASFPTGPRRASGSRAASPPRVRASQSALHVGKFCIPRLLAWVDVRVGMVRYFVACLRMMRLLVEKTRWYGPG